VQGTVIVTSYGYDRLNERTEMVEAWHAQQDYHWADDVQRTSVLVYDGAGNLVVQTTGIANTNSREVTTVFSYDALNRQTGVTEAAGTDDERHTSLGYDAADNLLSVTRPGPSDYPNGVTTSYAYDGVNRRTLVIEAYGLPQEERRTRTVYDGANDVVRVFNALGVMTKYAYDGVNQLTATTEAVAQPEQRLSTMAYDGAGNLLSVTMGQAPGSPLPNYDHAFTTRYLYDALNRRTDVFEAWNRPEQRHTNTTYDAADNVTKVVAGLAEQDANYNHPVTTTFRYDGLNRRTSETPSPFHRPGMAPITVRPSTKPCDSSGSGVLTAARRCSLSLWRFIIGMPLLTSLLRSRVFPSKISSTSFKRSPTVLIVDKWPR
jgi:YD repeat-containing protein